jgi:hypothetical protein
MSPVRSGVLAAAVLIAISAASRGAAQEARARARLRWEAGGCASRDVLAAAVEQRLGRSVFADDADAQLEVEGASASASEGEEQVATFVLRRGGAIVGRREVRARDCAALDRALPIVVALAVDLEQAEVRLAIPAEPAADPAPPEAPASPAVIVAGPITDTTPRVESATAIALRVGGAIELGLLPDPAPSVRVAVRLEPPGAFPLELRAATILPTSSLRDGRGVAYWGALFALAGCPALVRDDAVGLELCAGLESGPLVVRGEGFEINREVLLALFDAFAGLRLALRPWDALEIGLEASAGVPIPAHRFTVAAGDGTAREAAAGAPVCGRLELTIGVVTR